ncbi:SPFH domain-containing protein [Microbulbifer sp. SSSA002]|uniref:SPFH domain-containing protein n=1 Tax=unclassified Microbulbifer TaxID=2619833 RepID=UPI00403A31BB
MFGQDFESFLVWSPVFAVVVVVLLAKAIVIVEPRQYHFVLFLGAYWKTATPGLNLIVPFLSWVDKKASTALNEVPVELTLKTSNHVTFGLVLKVQHQITTDVHLAHKALYELEDYQAQLKSIVTDIAIPIANSIKLEDVYNNKDQIADKAKEQLRHFFHCFGVQIIDVLSGEPRLPKSVEIQANKVIEMQRERQAAAYEAEAIREREAGKAKADGQSVKIRMKMMGEARRMYAESAAEAIKVLVKAGTSADEALRFLSAIADNDALVTAARHGNTMVMAASQAQQQPSIALPIPDKSITVAKRSSPQREPQPA